MVEAADLARAKRAEVLGVVAGTFARREAWAQAGKYVDGLLADLPRKNGWTLAEHGGTGLRTGCSVCSTTWRGTRPPRARRYGTS
jgi:hypothetical protein